MHTGLRILFSGMAFFIITATSAQKRSSGKIPIIVITDCYHPYQDPGDNLDLIQDGI